MTNPSAVPEDPAFRSAAPAVERRDRNIAFVCALLLLIAMPVGWLPGSTSDVIGMCVIGLAVLAIMAGLILWFLPRERTHEASRVNRTALILGILAIITCGVFWTGLPLAVGAAAIALGVSQRESVAPGQGRGKATAGAVLGALAVLASFVLLLIG